MTVTKVCVFDHISWRTLDQTLMKSRQRHSSIAKDLDFLDFMINQLKNLVKKCPEIT